MGGRGVLVDEEWLNFQNFAQWCCSQEDFGREDYQLDKDLTVIGSKTYGPSTCCFIPEKLNRLLTSRVSLRGEYPVGVTKKGTKFIAECHDGYGGKIKTQGHKDPESAFISYKEMKEGVIKKLAKEYFNRKEINVVVYENLLKFNVVPFPE